MLGERPFHGIGVNYFSLFSRLLNNPQDDSTLTNLAALGNLKIPFVRFMCGGFWPVEQRMFLTNRAAFFERLDRVVHSAEQNHVGLIPSLFWNLATVPDLFGEPMQALGNTNSKSISFIRTYTKELVERYRESSAIWAWEFGNECNLIVDLPNAAEHRPPIIPELGTANGRTELDELKFSQLRVAFVEFAGLARKLDSRRLIVSGNSLPRESAWHNTHEKSWVPDNLEQFREILRRDNPDPMNGISIHIYPAEKFPGGAKSITAATILAVKESAAVLKPLFVGEFGVSRQVGPVAAQKAVFGELLSAIEKAHVPLAAVWVFDLPDQEQEWNINFGNPRAIFLKMICDANERIAK